LIEYAQFLAPLFNIDQMRYSSYVLNIATIFLIHPFALEMIVFYYIFHFFYLLQDSLSILSDHLYLKIALFPQASTILFLYFLWESKTPLD
jgi:hypothetical protein